MKRGKTEQHQARKKGGRGSRQARRNWLRLLAAAAILACVAGIAAHYRMSIARFLGKYPNVVLISIDTCRADRLSCYGYPRETTPRLDELARRSIVFSEAVTPAPNTLPAHCSMLTGMLPPSHGVRYNLKYRLGTSSLTLAEILKAKGYETGAIIGSFILDSRFGLDQGFDTYNDEMPTVAGKKSEESERRGEEVSGLALKWLDRDHDKPFFLFLHYYDPHTPYAPPEPYAAQFKEDPYAGEIAYVDHCIGSVLDKLKALNLYDSSLIIVVGDHGESLGQHAEEDHGFFLYQSTLHVPLMVKRPGQEEGRWIKEQRVSVVDLTPTILGCAGIKVPADMSGRDLTPCLEGKPVPSSYEKRVLYSETIVPTQYECAPLFGLVSATTSPGRNWKYIETLRPEIYDLSSDPAERTNAATSDPARLESLRNTLASIRKAMASPAPQETELKLDPKSIERLRALGYVAGGQLREDSNVEHYRYDPKDFVTTYYDIRKVVDLTRERRCPEARAIAEKVQARWPDLPGAYSALGVVECMEGRPDAAVAHFNTYLSLVAKARASGKFAGPPAVEEAGVLSDLASALIMLGKLEEATERFRLACDLAPDLPETHRKLGVLLWKRGLAEEAAQHIEACLKLDPDQPAVRDFLATIRSKRAFPPQTTGSPGS